VLGDFVTLFTGGQFGHFTLWWVIGSSYVMVGDLVILCTGGQFGHFMYWWAISHKVNWRWAILHWVVYYVPVSWIEMHL